MQSRDVQEMPNYLIAIVDQYMFKSYRYPASQFTAYTQNMFPVKDITVDDGELFILKANGQVCRTKDPAQPLDCFDQAPASASQIAVDRNGVYIGTTNSQIWRAPNPSSNVNPNGTATQAHSRMP